MQGKTKVLGETFYANSRESGNDGSFYLSAQFRAALKRFFRMS
jgi:hypothetical protein